jgi:hypothetical protein
MAPSRNPGIWGPAGGTRLCAFRALPLAGRQNQPVQCHDHLVMRQRTPAVGCQCSATGSFRQNADMFLLPRREAPERPPRHGSCSPALQVLRFGELVARKGDALPSRPTPNWPAASRPIPEATAPAGWRRIMTASLAVGLPFDRWIAPRGGAPSSHR